PISTTANTDLCSHPLHDALPISIDARKQLKDWHKLDYDDSGWRAASERLDADHQLVLQPTRTVEVYRMPPARIVQRGADRYWIEDRKSTRLNSSHVKISYAVFCL